MSTWKIAGAQIDCRLADPARNLALIRTRLRDAAARGARLVVFPECARTGYCFDSRDEALPFAEPVPGPSTETLTADCQELNVWAAVGLLEHDPTTGGLYNACALVGPHGPPLTYRKIHLPFLG